MDRRAIEISGIVQGVGFRPFVFELANRLGLSGFVRNESGGVSIEVEGDRRNLDRFVSELSGTPPPLARIESLRWSSRPPVGERIFRIESSRLSDNAPIFIAPDVAPCADCLRELFDPGDRRYRYPFVNCTNCGPRLSIVREAPYDRVRTTMSEFPMCRSCRREYDDPGDRRFHAQPIACPECGPRLNLLDGQGSPLRGGDPLEITVQALRAGRIVAIKGLGGYHLACLASDGLVVSELRRRKQRDEKPFAVMVGDLATAESLCEIKPEEAALLRSSRRPVVLLRRRPDADIAPRVAPRSPILGVMLPSTPLHHLIFRELGGSPLVMTSGNRSDEPIAYRDRDAISQLAGICDLFLTHNRGIHLRSDDSVTRMIGGLESPLRLSRGDAPTPLDLEIPCQRPILAVGGQLKSCFALGRGHHAFLSHHIGDLEHYEAYRSFSEAIGHYEKLFEIQPRLIVHDLHPDYASTRHALNRGRDESIPCLAVQHHHAHLASCMADRNLEGPVIGVIFDGAGYGPDGTIWGGEFLVGDAFDYRRAAHLRPVPMPGGEKAIREPWRMAMAYLDDAGCDFGSLRDRIATSSLSTTQQMIERRLNCPITSSVGRLFDAVAAIAGIRESAHYEGQAATELEWISDGVHDSGAYGFELSQADDINSPFIVDARPLIREIALESERRTDPAIIGRRFHSSLGEIVARVCSRLRKHTGFDRIVLSGGVFQNALLTEEVIARLERDSFRVYRHQRVPPGDGGLCLGQLTIAAAQDHRYKIRSHARCVSESPAE